MNEARARIARLFVTQFLEAEAEAGHPRPSELEAAMLAEEVCRTLRAGLQDEVPVILDRRGLRFVLDPWAEGPDAACPSVHVLTWMGNRWVGIEEFPFPRNG